MYRLCNFWDLKQCPLQRSLLYSVPISEGPLLEVSLYTHAESYAHSL